MNEITVAFVAWKCKTNIETRHCIFPFKTMDGNEEHNQCIEIKGLEDQGPICAITKSNGIGMINVNKSIYGKCNKRCPGG